MGGKCPHRKVKKRGLSHKTARRGKFLIKADDAVYDELLKLADEGKDADAKQLPVDEDLPGMGQFYCLHCESSSTDLVKLGIPSSTRSTDLVELEPYQTHPNTCSGGDCSRYFANESVKEDHYRSKRHKKRVKQMSGPAPHTQLDAELAAGMGMPDNGLKLMSM